MCYLHINICQSWEWIELPRIPNAVSFPGVEPSATLTKDGDNPRVQAVNETHPEQSPAADQGGTGTLAREKRDGRMKSDSEFNAVLIDWFNVLDCFISSYVKS